MYYKVYMYVTRYYFFNEYVASIIFLIKTHFLQNNCMTS